MTRTRVLVVEDDEDFQDLYKKFFDHHAEEFTWSLAKTGDAAISALKDSEFDVALLDWHLNRGTKNGFQVLQAIQSEPTNGMVTFMVTANDHESDIQIAIEAGADDYVTKPFNMDLLAARLRGRLNRQRQQAPVEHKVLELDGLRLVEQTGIVMLNGQRLDLWKTEVSLLTLFLTQRDRVLSQDQLWHSVRGYESGTAGKALTIQISNLRKKLGAWGERIETRRGLGYVLNTNLPVS
ncbi:MAG TPA: response regulator transcription factor [Elusimicrobiota bacterium]|nr:response regulator transcription factor [Elusimicrobiota bacterium]